MTSALPPNGSANQTLESGTALSPESGTQPDKSTHRHLMNGEDAAPGRVFAPDSLLDFMVAQRVSDWTTEDGRKIHIVAVDMTGGAP